MVRSLSSIQCEKLLKGKKTRTLEGEIVDLQALAAPVVARYYRSIRNEGASGYVITVTMGCLMVG